MNILSNEILKRYMGRKSPQYICEVEIRFQGVAAYTCRFDFFRYLPSEKNTLYCANLTRTLWSPYVSVSDDQNGFNDNKWFEKFPR